jgi:protein-tyrosine phosphatase
MANTRELKEREKYMDDMQSKREHEARQDQLLAIQQKQKKKMKRNSPSKTSKVKKSRSPYWYSSSSEDEEVASNKSSTCSSSRSSSDNEQDDSDYEDFSASRSGSDSDKENFQDALEGFSSAAIGSTAALGWRTASSASAANKPAQFKKSKSLSAAVAAKKNKASQAVIEEKKEEFLHLAPEEILHLECFATSQNTSHPSAHQIIIDAILEHCMWIRTQARPQLRTSLDLRGPKSTTKDAHIAARRVLIHCSDGYTDSSLLTLAYIMYDRVCSLPEAYLYLQNDKKRSFFVYPLDVTLLGQLEKRVMALARSQNRHKYNDDLSTSQIAEMEKKEREEKAAAATRNAREPPSPTISTRSLLTRPSLFSRSSSATSSATISSIRSATPTIMAPLSRCSPSPSSTPSNDAVAHAWFYDDRFDGHFPSRILDHVYLGNVNHASNALMLKELGITHVLSIGESALVPPHKHVQPTSSAFYSNASAAARARTPTNSLWLEQSLGNITVLDIQDIQDDGVDPILPHLLTAIEFIEAAHQKGGKVLVHCRVGVSRSATLVIAYIMKHLDLSLVDAYLLVRAKRLNILIQPTILFMWTLHMYEEEIRESAFNDQEEEKENDVLMKRSARITWPVLATEMANLNHKCKPFPRLNIIVIEKTDSRRCRSRRLRGSAGLSPLRPAKKAQSTLSIDINPYKQPWWPSYLYNYA